MFNFDESLLNRFKGPGSNPNAAVSYKNKDDANRQIIAG